MPYLLSIIMQSWELRNAEEIALMKTGDSEVCSNRGNVSVKEGHLISIILWVRSPKQVLTLVLNVWDLCCLGEATLEETIIYTYSISTEFILFNAA